MVERFVVEKILKVKTTQKQLVSLKEIKRARKRTDLGPIFIKNRKEEK